MAQGRGGGSRREPRRRHLSTWSDASSLTRGSQPFGWRRNVRPASQAPDNDTRFQSESVIGFDRNTQLSSLGATTWSQELAYSINPAACSFQMEAAPASGHAAKTTYQAEAESALRQFS